MLLAACGETAPPPAAPKPPSPAPTTTLPPAPAAKTETLAADSDRTTTGGSTFIAPAGWSITVRGPATILEASETGSRIALVDVEAKDADAAVAAASAAYAPEKKWPLKVVTDVADKDGWTRHKSYVYQTSPNEKRGVSADPLWSGKGWTVAIYENGRCHRGEARRRGEPDLRAAAAQGICARVVRRKKGQQARRGEDRGALRVGA